MASVALQCADPVGKSKQSYERYSKFPGQSIDIATAYYWADKNQKDTQQLLSVPGTHNIGRNNRDSEYPVHPELWDQCGAVQYLLFAGMLTDTVPVLPLAVLCQAACLVLGRAGSAYADLDHRVPGVYANTKLQLCVPGQLRIPGSNAQH